MIFSTQIDVTLEKSNVLNLAFGYPDYRLLSETQFALLENASAPSQYSPGTDSPRLLEAISKFYSKLLNKTLNVDDNIIITSGEIEALYHVFSTPVQKGNEWIIFEPCDKFYLSTIMAVEGIPKPIQLKPV
ncbi:uncharacterized protein LOC131671910 [Phymastichus coffea]|uniref:uncharacterized protein LOC131671910 n=1 Tax=Phymastichus coffea TaxID=108790 RepID=UPI00273CBE23|nr:uncharacterized protein LOC131671910 [Phymastichus coffea]